MYDFNDIQKASLEQLDWHKLTSHLAKKTTSSLGQELAKNLRPNFDADIEEHQRQLAITASIKQKIQYSNLRIDCSQLNDSRQILETLAKGHTLDASELRVILNNVVAGNHIIDVYQDCFVDDQGLLELATPFHQLDDLRQSVAHAIDSRGQIRDTASPELEKIRSEIKELDEKIHKKMYASLKKQRLEEYFQDDYITIREDRMVLPLKANMRGKLAGIIHGSSGSGNTYFIEPEDVIADNNSFKLLCHDERVEIESILKNLSYLARQMVSELQDNEQTLGRLDLAQAKTMLAIEIDGKLPQLVQSNDTLQLMDIRHPLLTIAHKGNKHAVIANNLILPRNIKSAIVSGPNAGGKTIFLKSIGLNILMAMSGLLPSVGKASHLPACRQLYTELGDHQSIEQGLSTFSAHMVALKQIIEASTSETMIICDELAHGTDAAEGAALAQAILESMATAHFRTITSTHYRQLTQLPISDERFMNASFQVDNQGQPTFNLVEGVPGRSSAISTAKTVGMPDGLIERASQLMDPLQRDELEIANQQQYWQLKKEKLEKDTQNLIEEEKKIAEKMASLENEIQENLQKKYSEFRLELSEARQWLRSQKNAGKASDPKSVEVQIAQVQESVVEKAPSTLKEKVLQRAIEIGDGVEVLASKQKGRVLKEADKRGFIELQIGSMRLKLHKDELVIFEQPRTSTKKQQNDVSYSSSKRLEPSIPFTPQSVENTLDVRGKRLEEALEFCEKFIDNATMNGPNEVIVIHGHGSNLLKKEIRQYLESCYYDIRYRPGKDGEGGDGVTIITLLGS